MLAFWIIRNTYARNAKDTRFGIFRMQSIIYVHELIMCLFIKASVVERRKEES